VLPNAFRFSLPSNFCFLIFSATLFHNAKRLTCSTSFFSFFKQLHLFVVSVVCSKGFLNSTHTQVAAQLTQLKEQEGVYFFRMAHLNHRSFRVQLYMIFFMWSFTTLLCRCSSSSFFPFKSDSRLTHLNFRSHVHATQRENPESYNSHKPIEGSLRRLLLCVNYINSLPHSVDTFHCSQQAQSQNQQIPALPHR